MKNFITYLKEMYGHIIFWALLILFVGGCSYGCHHLSKKLDAGCEQHCSPKQKAWDQYGRCVCYESESK